MPDALHIRRAERGGCGGEPPAARSAASQSVSRSERSARRERADRSPDPLALPQVRRYAANVVETRGVEPLTSALRTLRSTN